ncbi:hypothetical protein [Nocardioides sp. InS609-2]|uniref:hypothetical protein n=1 Tax=Nocardioides sp. InS609-2 TaxID=2760705 RepID=UPI0020BEB4BA|nr:hypothetical protein [Nocardioides sp. InS609-2]
MPKGQYDRTPEARAASAENMRKARAAQSPTWARARGEANRRRREDPETHAQAAAVAADNWSAWRAANPDKAAEANHNAGLVSTAQRWKCNDCTFVSHAMGVARHQRAKDHHRGRTRIDNIDKETA